MTDFEYRPAPREESSRNLVLVCWVLFGVAIFTAYGAGLVAFIIAALKRGDAAGTRYASHFDALIRASILCFIGYVVGGILTFVLIGWPILLLTFLYNAYVAARGLVRWNDRQAYD